MGGGVQYRASESQQSRNKDAQKPGYKGACIPCGRRTGHRKTCLARAQFSEMVTVLVSLLLVASELSARLRPDQAVVANSSFPKEQEQLKKKPPWNGF